VQEYTHNPTRVRAIQVARPWKAVANAVPFAHQVKNERNGFCYFTIQNPGEMYSATAVEGDWIVRQPDGKYRVMNNDDFQYQYGEEQNDDTNSD
jgi:hypothetical protein